MTTTSTTRPQVITRQAEIRDVVRAAQTRGQSVGVVMTMGALHRGHTSLVQECSRRADITVVTIFVNPTQFVPGEDFGKYPRDLDQDLAALEECKVDFVFAPAADEMYRQSFSTFVEPPSVAQPLEGVCRPRHYRGVCTIVLKLLQAIPADVALFGHKDYQQYLVLKTMAEDLSLATEIRVCPTIREPDGLALSSRNIYLNKSQRQRALAISQGLLSAARLVRDGHRSVSQVATEIRKHLRNAEISRIDYVAVVDAETLGEIQEIRQPAVALVAAFVGNTRLIDNILLEPAAE